MKSRNVILSAAALLATAGMAQAQFTEGFEDVTNLPGWFQQNNSVPGTTNWFQGNVGVFPAFGGAGYIGANFNNTTGLNTISNWLVTPVVPLTNGATLTFYTRTVSAPAFPDRLQVRMNKANTGTNVGTGATGVGDFTDLLLDINPTYTTAGYPNAWTQQVATVSGVTGTVNGRLAFRYFVENAGPSGANSDYIGIDDAVYAVVGVLTGRCCFADGSCTVVTAAACGTAGGTYGGDNTTCTPNVCPQPTGACCAPAGTCSVLTSAACIASGGTYQGNGSVCGSCPTVVFSNCNISTGPTTLNGVAAPSGGVWSECARDAADPTTANTTAGFGFTGAFRLADDFVVPSGGATITGIRVYGYTTGVSAPAITAATLQILDASPAGTANVIFGDQVTNRLAAGTNVMTNIYRTFNTVTPPACGGALTAPGTTRRLQSAVIAVNPPLVLSAGTYWVDYNVTGVSFAPPATHPTAIGRQCNPNNSNGLQFNAGWVPLNDAGQGCAPVAVQQDMYFEVLGTVAGGCYANCDGSTGAPLLTANDFQCFLNKYAAGNTYANCDGSTGNPLLTANDFQCFLNKYAAGCS
jgi:hypothetical protein